MQTKEIIVYKLGTSSIVKDDRLDIPFINNLAKQFLFVRQELKITPVIVCSGSIYNGRKIIESSLRSEEIVDKQAAAIYGQVKLIDVWRFAFGNKVNVGEALLKDEDINNFKKPLLRASQFGIVILNGPDATYDSCTEKQIISIDNDRLARCVAYAAGANTLALLTATEGLLDREKNVIREVATLEDIERIDFFEKTVNGTGGPRLKLLEARSFLTDFNKTAYIVGSRIDDVIVKIARGEKVGTRVTLPLQGILL